MNPEDVLTKEETVEINEILKKLDKSGNYEYMDNCRFAEINNMEQIRAYKKAKEHGCCGFYDSTYKLRTGKIIMFGFNYGH